MKHNIFIFFLAAGIVLVAGLAGSVHGAYGLEDTASASGLSASGVSNSVPTIIGDIIGTGLSLVSVLFFILMIYGGIRWMLARGKEEEVKKSLDTIISAIIGIIVVLAAYAITNFVFKAVGAGGGGGGGGKTPTKPNNTPTETVGCCLLNSGTETEAVYGTKEVKDTAACHAFCNAENGPILCKFATVKKNECNYSNAAFSSEINK